jgi:hypothetical protein
MYEFGYIDQILTGLLVIGMIKEGQKVSVRNGFLNIDDRRFGAFSGFIRWMNNDNRQNTLSYIRNVVNNALAIACTNPDNKSRVDDGLAKAVIGLSALSVTYSDDAAVSAVLSVMKERIINYTSGVAF